MLKPSATKIAAHKTIEEMVAAFKAKGGSVTKCKDAVALGLKKRKYLKEKAT